MANINLSFVETHDETKPAGTRDRSLGDDDIREMKRAIRERLAIDHQSDEDESGNGAIGTHKKVTFSEAQGSDPTTYDDVSYLYIKETSSILELFYLDDAGNVIQLTSNGKILGDYIKLSNNTYITAKDAAGTGTVNLIKINASDVPEILTGAVLSSSAAPTDDAGIANKKYVDDQVATKAALAAVNSRSTYLAAQQAVGTSDISVSSDTLADMTNMSITLTTVGTKVLIMFSAAIEMAGNGSGCYAECVIDIDGTDKVAQRTGTDSGTTSFNNGITTAMQWLETGLTPGSHTIKIEWRGKGTDVPNITQHGSDSPRVLTVIDLD